MATKKTEEVPTEAAPQEAVSSVPSERLTYEAVQEDGGYRVTATYGGERANAWNKTEAGAKAALRAALIPVKEK